MSWYEDGESDPLRPLVQAVPKGPAAVRTEGARQLQSIRCEVSDLSSQIRIIQRLVEIATRGEGEDES